LHQTRPNLRSLSRTGLRRRASRGWRAGTVSAAVLGLVTGAAKLSTAGSDYEAPPVLKAADLASSPELLQGPRFRVEPEVPTDGLLATFTIKSDFGTFTATGPGMLGIQVGEIQALDTLEKTSKSEAFQRALEASVKRTGKSIATAVTNPVETVKRLPEGVGRFFERVGRSVQTGAQKAGDYIENRNSPEAQGKSAGQVASDVGTAAGNAGSDIIGQESSRRRIAKVLRVDPYTTNTVLDAQLNEFAWVVWAGEFGLDVGIGLVPGGMAIKITRTWVSDLVWDLSPADLDVRAQKQLTELVVPKETIDQFLRQKWFTRTTRTALLESLKTLGPGPGRTDVIPWALTAQSDAQARFMAGAVIILAAYHTTQDPISRLRVSGTLVGERQAGGLVVPAPVDYVAWTERVARFATRPDLAGRDRQIWLTGRLSPRARQELTALKWGVRENVQSILGPGGPAELEGTATNPKPSP
jgi:hypothetical protein